MEQDEINDLNEDLLHLRNGLGDNINDANNKRQYIEEGGILNEDEEQGNHFGNANKKHSCCHLVNQRRHTDLPQIIPCIYYEKLFLSVIYHLPPCLTT